MKMHRHLFSPALVTLVAVALLSTMGCGTPRERAESAMKAAGEAVVKGQELLREAMKAEADGDAKKSATLNKEVAELKKVALDMSNAAIERDPTNLDAYNNLGLILQSTGDRASFEKAIKVYQDGLGVLYKNFHPPPYKKLAEDSLQNLYNIFNNQLGVCHRRLEQYDSAFVYFARIKNAMPKSYANAQFLYGFYLQALSGAEKDPVKKAAKIDSAIARFEAALILDPKSGATSMDQPVAPYIEEAYKAKAKALGEKTPNYEGIISAYRKAIERDSSDAENYSRLAIALEKSDRKDEASKMYLTAIAKNPQSHTLRNNYAMMLDKSGKSKEGIVQLREALKINPQYGTAYANLVTLLFNSGDKAGALEQLKKYETAVAANAAEMKNVTTLKEALGVK